MLGVQALEHIAHNYAFGITSAHKVMGREFLFNLWAGVLVTTGLGNNVYLKMFQLTIIYLVCGRSGEQQ